MQLPAPKRLSIVIPSYNEESRIGATLADILSFISTLPYKTEVLVVNDGSKDRTAEVVASHMSAYSDAGFDLRIVTNTPNRGKGFSVKRGILDARAEVVLFTDADLSSPIREVPKLIDPIVAGVADLTMGSRALNRELIGIHQSAFREFGGRVFNLLLRIITGMPFKDTQCGFKAFRRSLIVPVCNLQRIERFGFDPEMIYIGLKRGLKTQEVPVEWNDCEGSSVRYFSDSMNMFLDLIRIRWNDLRGRYDGKAGGPPSLAAAEASGLDYSSRDQNA